jgi:hypothetical protein
MCVIPQSKYFYVIPQKSYECLEFINFVKIIMCVIYQSNYFYVIPQKSYECFGVYKLCKNNF